MGQGASLARAIIQDTKEIVRMTNKASYEMHYNSYKDAAAKLEAAKRQNAKLRAQLEQTKATVYAQSEAFRDQKLGMDEQVCIMCRFKMSVWTHHPLVDREVCGKAFPREGKVVQSSCRDSREHDA